MYPADTIAKLLQRPLHGVIDENVGAAVAQERARGGGEVERCRGVGVQLAILDQALRFERQRFRPLLVVPGREQ